MERVSILLLLALSIDDQRDLTGHPLQDGMKDK